MTSRKSQYRTNIVLGGLVLAAAAAAWWSRGQVPDSVRDERQGRVLRADRKSTRLNSSHNPATRMPSSA
jgi:hypothetical protein